ncbi:MAG: DNA primase [Geobacteraceae bacterium GWB2_52_12]|nr:MAG: DNA primase [Geobacteraceae bacterium GWB2_52_12]
MRIPEKEKREILEYCAVNIAAIVGDYLPLKPQGRSLAGCCPFHGEKTPSFSVSPERGTWHCFGSCSEGGDAAKFIMKMEGINFNEALVKLAARGGITIPGAGETKEEKERKALLSVLAKAGKFFRDCLAADTNGGKAYVESRLTPEMVDVFGIGFAPKNDGKALLNHLKKHGVSEEIAEKAGLIRKGDDGSYRDVFWGGRVIFPIRNKGGYIIGFAGRRIDGESKFKYVNSPETPLYKKYSALFGLDQADFSTGEVFVVEGYIDLMAMWSAGIRNVVAACGTAFTEEHVVTLKKYGVRRLNLMFDGDAAGIKATQRTASLAFEQGIKAVVYSLPDEHDPDSFLKSGGNMNNITAISSFEYLEKSGIELSGTMRELYRLERLERAMLYVASKSSAVAGLLKKRGNLDELFSQEGLAQLQEVLQQD